VIGELGGTEKVDIIQYSDDAKQFITSALAPAKEIEVILDEKKKAAVVLVPDDQLSLAIGRDGQNVRLAAKLTGWKIDIKGKGPSAGSGQAPSATEETQPASASTDAKVLEDKKATAGEAQEKPAEQEKKEEKKKEEVPAKSTPPDPPKARSDGGK
jgi:transcription termination/antitermination protein NusA